MALIIKREAISLGKNNQQKAVNTTLLTLILVAVLAWGSLRPTIQTITNTSKKYNEYSAALEKLKTFNTNLTQLISSQDENKDDLKKIDLYYPYDANYSLFIANLKEISTQHGFALNGVSFTAQGQRQLENTQKLKYSNLASTAFRLEIEGALNNLPEYLVHIERLPYSPKIIGVAYSPNARDVTKNKINITIVLYRLNNKVVQNESEL